MKRFNTTIPAIVIAILFIVFGTGCRENTILNANLDPNANNVIIHPGIDTFTLLTKTVYDSSDIITSQAGTIQNQALGNFNDPYFGNTNAGMYLQLIPSSLGNNLSTLIVDSAVLILPYSGFTYGNTTSSASPHSYTVYRISDTLSVNSNYYSYTNKPVNKGVVLGSVSNVNINALASEAGVIVDTSLVPPHIRIRMDPANFTGLIRSADSSQINDVLTFLKWFNGIYIEETSQFSYGNNVPYIKVANNGATNPNYAKPGIIIYYRKSISDTVEHSDISFYYDGGTYCAFYNKISRKYSNIANAYFTSSAQSDSIVSLQNLPGASIDIQAPFLQNSLPNCVINAAQLIITQVHPANDPFTASVFAQPSRLYPFEYIQSTSLLQPTQDNYPITDTFGSNFIGGRASMVTVGSKTTTQYVLNLPREVLHTIQTKSVLHLRLIGTVDYPGAYRLLAAGGNYADTNYRMRLNIVYSTLKK